MRVVLDAKVLVQAAWSPSGPVNGVVALIFTGQVRPLFDQRNPGEYDDVLAHPQCA